MIGQLINRFDNLSSQTVKDFNEVFTVSPILQKDLIFELESEAWEVEIGLPLGGTTRELTITAPDGIKFNTFIELRTEDNLIKSNKNKRETQQKIFGEMISSIINGSYKPEGYAERSSGTNNEASNETGANDPGRIQEMDEE